MTPWALRNVGHLKWMLGFLGTHIRHKKSPTKSAPRPTKFHHVYWTSQLWLPLHMTEWVFMACRNIPFLHLGDPIPKFLILAIGFSVDTAIDKFSPFCIIIFTNPSARAGYDTRSIFKRSLTGLNSELSFS